VTNDEINKYHQDLILRHRDIAVNTTYAEGANHTIMSADDKLKPDNRIPFPTGKSIITDIVGFAGRPGELKTEYVNTKTKEPDEITELLKSFDEHNNEGLENGELLENALGLGSSHELWWISDDLKLGNGVMTPEYTMINNYEGITVYDDSLKPRKKAFLRFWGDKKEKKLDAYYPKYSERYVNTGKGWERDTTGDTKYPYEGVPEITFFINKKGKPIFEAQKPLIDAIDALISKGQNEWDRWASAILMTPRRLDADDIKALTEKDFPVFEDLGPDEKWPEYLNKDLSGIVSFYEKQKVFLSEEIRESVKVPNFQDPNFASGDQSGYAILLKLAGFEFIISGIEVYFRKGLKSRFELYKSIIDASTLPKVNWGDYEQKIIWNRNLPADLKSKVEIAMGLTGLGATTEDIRGFLPEGLISKQEEEREPIPPPGIDEGKDE